MAVAVALGARQPVQKDGILAAVIGAASAFVVAMLGFVQVLKVKRIDAHQAQIEQLTKQVNSLSSRLESQQKELVDSRTQQFVLQQELIRQEASFNNQLTNLKEDTRKQSIQYEQKIYHLEHECEDLKEENAQLKVALAQAATIGSIERRHTQQMSTSGAPDCADVPPVSVNPKE